MIVIAVVAGILVGISLGALGGGGAIITVPVLVYVLGQSAHEATTSSLVIVGVTAFIAAITHACAGRVRWVQGLIFGAVGTLGTLLGSQLASGIAANTLLGLFATLLFVVAILLWRRAAAATGPVDDVEGRESAGLIVWNPQFVCDCPAVLKVVVTAVGVGLLTGFFGVGGGFAVVPALVMALRFTMPVAIGTSLFVIALNSATALASRLGGGVALDWRVVGIFTFAAVAASLLGSRVTSRLPAATLQRAFALLLLLVAGYTAARTLLGG